MREEDKDNTEQRRKRETKWHSLRAVSRGEIEKEKEMEQKEEEELTYEVNHQRRLGLNYKKCTHHPFLLSFFLFFSSVLHTSG